MKRSSTKATPSSAHGKGTTNTPSTVSSPSDLAPSFLRRTSQGAVLDVSVVPNAKRTEADGLHDGALRVRLHAVPVEGAANDALVRWLADGLNVPRRQVELIRGQTSRRKTVAITADAARIEAWLATLPTSVP